MQKVVLFIEHSNHAFNTSVKVANLFMNRFAIEENDSSEILNIFELGGYETQNKGMDHFIVTGEFP